jgi:hypothetical protein
MRVGVQPISQMQTTLLAYNVLVYRSICAITTVLMTIRRTQDCPATSFLGLGYGVRFRTRLKPRRS